MPKTVILSAARTPIGKLGGGLASVDATELGGTAIKAALERAEVAPEQVQHVVMGQVLQAGQGQIPSRQAQIKAGIPKEVSSETINKVCASGIRAAGMLDAAIRAGDLEVGVGGGMESMSNAPYLLKEARFGFRMGDGKAHRRDDQRRAHEPVQRQAHGPGGHRGRRRARDDPRRHGPLGAALARAGDQGDRRGPPARGDRPGHDQRPQGRHRGRDRRGAAPRHHPRGAGQAAPDLPQGRLAHGRQLARRQRRRRRAGGGQRRVGQGQRQARAGDDHRPGAGRRRLRLSGPHPGQGGPEGAGEGRPDAPRTSTCGRSTRRSRRSR